MKNFLVYGDAFVDEYIEGTAKLRSNPESDAPLVSRPKVKQIAGGAANVAMNLKELGANVQLLTPWRFTDDVWEKIRGKIDLHYLGFYPAIKKTRIIADGKQLARVDFEKVTRFLVSESYSINECSDMLQNTDCVVISDYTKGSVSARSADAISDMANNLIEAAYYLGIPVIVDSKLPWWTNDPRITAVLPNDKEWFDVKIPPEELSKEHKTIWYIVTRGAGGVSLYYGGKSYSLPAFTKDAVDVTGAGDSVTAAFAYYFINNPNPNPEDILEFVNAAGASAVSKQGTYSVKMSDIANFKNTLKAWEI